MNSDNSKRSLLRSQRFYTRRHTLGNVEILLPSRQSRAFPADVRLKRRDEKILILGSSGGADPSRVNKHARLRTGLDCRTDNSV